MIVLPARATHDAMASFVRGLHQAVVAEPSQMVVVDASGLEEFDSSVLAALLECRREALAAGKGFEVAHLPPRMKQLAGVYGIAELMPDATG